MHTAPLAGPCKTVPAVAAHGFGGGGGKALACVLGVAACIELALNIAFNFLGGGERDMNSKRFSAREIVRAF